MRLSNNVVYVAIDNLVSSVGQALTGFSDFLEGLSEANIPCVWVSTRNRHQLDSAIRKLGHAAPFIGEGGSGVYLPEDYFHLRPARTIRFARFTCIPVASPQPAAAEALDLLAEETGIAVVPLRTLSPRELSQNAGVPQREAELLRQRDFDELFFFAGASDAEIKRFQGEAIRRNLALRPRGNLWSVIAGANLSTCTRELNSLYQRALRTQPFTIALATSEEAADLFPCCKRTILFTDRSAAESSSAPSASFSLPLFSQDTWQAALDAILSRSL